MIIKSENPDAFIRGLARIEDPEALYEIATSSKTSKIRQASAELIEIIYGLSTYQHRITYYGPDNLNSVVKTLEQLHLNKSKFKKNKTFKF